MITACESGPVKPRLFLVGVPGKLGGAATKITHLIGLLRRDFNISVVLPDPSFRHDKEVRAVLGRRSMDAPSPSR